MTFVNNDHVTIETVRPGILRLTMAQGARMNTFTWDMLDSLLGAFQHLRQDPPRALIVTGQDKVFCGGAHLKYFVDPASGLANNPKAARDPYVQTILDVFDEILYLPCPTIAAINGHALGGGMELAIACDFRLISTTARMGQPEVRHGLTPGGNGIQQLIRLIGRPNALDMLLSGDAIDAETARDYGLVSRILPPGELATGAESFAARFLLCGPDAVALTKRAALRAADVPLAEANRIALDAVFEAFSNPESHEGVTAFVEKRRPAYVVDGTSE